MVDDHLIFLVTIPIHYGSNESSEISSEISSETNAKSSETGSGTSIQQGTSEKHIEFDLSTKISRS
jgi:hypothetical protein